jgi:hypothetical protein
MKLFTRPDCLPIANAAQVATQFMSESLGWADNIIFAMAPLGIITAIVGAIRVGGPAWLKAIIGRARENRSVAEAELMSSTSSEVCELWDGGQIVRAEASVPVRELLYVPRNPMPHVPRNPMPHVPGNPIYSLTENPISSFTENPIYSLKGALNAGYLREGE